MKITRAVQAGCFLLFVCAAASAQQAPRGVAQAPNRPATEGEGPFKRLIIRGATIIDGTCARPYSAVDVVIENNRIAALRVVSAPGSAIDDVRRPRAAL